MSAQIKYQLIPDANTVLVRTEDGGIASLYYNGVHCLTDYYQNRCKDSEIDWESLAEGKVYTKEWPKKTQIDKQMIDDALNWLHVNNKAEFIEVDVLLSDGEMDFLCEVCRQITEERFGEETYINISEEETGYSERAQDFFNERYDEIETLYIKLILNENK